MKDKRHLVKNRKRRERRRHRLRKVVSGTSERPRMVVHRSLRHIEVQLVDDVAGITAGLADACVSIFNTGEYL